MPARSRPPVFLGRASYRQRRLRDGARLVPVVGMALWMIPLLWPRLSEVGPALAQRTSSGLIYIFLVWAGLIVLSFVLSRLLRHGADDTEGEESD